MCGGCKHKLHSHLKSFPWREIKKEMSLKMEGVALSSSTAVYFWILQVGSLFLKRFNLFSNCIIYLHIQNSRIDIE